MTSTQINQNRCISRQHITTPGVLKGVTAAMQVSVQSNHTVLAVVPVVGEQATLVSLEMPASINLGSEDTGVKVKWNRTKARQTEEKIAGRVYKRN